MLETAPFAGIVPVLPDEIDKPEINEPNGKRGTIEENTLQSAFAHLGGNVGDIGAEPIDARREIAIQQGEALAKWAEENGLSLSPETWLGELVTGASEHDLWLRDGQYWKVTRPGHFGWVVIAGDDGVPRSVAATPIEYLARWINANSFLGDKAELRGVARTEHGVQIVVSQPHVEGCYPDSQQIMADMNARGFSLVPGFVMGANAPSFYRKVDRVAVFDASEDNFILSEGVPVPIDVITMVLSGKLEDQIKRLMVD